MICTENTIDFFESAPSAVSIGKFDGLHLGHQKLLSELRSAGEGLTKILFVISPERGECLLTRKELAFYAKEEGIDRIIFCPFVPEISHLLPEEFINRILIERLKASFVCVGEDFRFGRGRSGDASLLKELLEIEGAKAEIIPKVMIGGEKVSSSLIRETVLEGNMEIAAKLLGRPYQITGEVIHGNHIGTGMGIPTANIRPPEEKVLPPYGVYFTRILTEGEKLCGISNLGVKPTVGDTGCGLETYLYDSHPDLYGRTISAALLHFVRAERRFPSLEALSGQTAKDLEAGREYFIEQGFMERQSDSDHIGDHRSLGGRGNIIL